MNVIRATFPTPFPRPPVVGGDLADPLRISFVGGTFLLGHIAGFDQVAPDGGSRKVSASAFKVEFTPAEATAIRNACMAALKRGGVVPADATFAIVDVPGGTTPVVP